MEKIVQISSGRGPVECEWVVGQIAKLILQACRAQRVEASFINSVEGDENNTFKSISIWCQGKDLAFLEAWIGSIQYIGKSKFRKFHKRKNWFVNVQFIEVDAQLSDIKPSDLKWQAFRASGPGGQHVNKVSSAVRVIHLPTGITAESQNQRSQSQNKKEAMKKLKVKLQLNHKQHLQTNQQNNWMQHNLLVRGNPVKTFKGMPLLEVT